MIRQVIPKQLLRTVKIKTKTILFLATHSLTFALYLQFSLQNSQSSLPVCPKQYFSTFTFISIFLVSAQNSQKVMTSSARDYVVSNKQPIENV